MTSIDVSIRRTPCAWLIAVVATLLPQASSGQQTATATGSCGVAINASGQAQVTVTNNCDAKTAAIVEKLLKKSARQEQQIGDLNGSLQSMAGDLDALRREVKGLTAAVTTVQEAAARPSATVAEKRAEELLAGGDASAAAELLGRRADTANNDAPALLRQQSALLALTDANAALAALERALKLEPGNFDMLWRAGDLALSAGLLDKASQYYDRMGNAALLQLKTRPDAAAVNHVAVAFIKNGDVKAVQGDYAGGLSLYRVATAIATKQVQSGVRSTDVLKTLAQGLRISGTALKTLKDTKGAVKATQDALVVAKALVKEEARNPDFWNILLLTHLSLADVQRADGDRRAAKENLDAASRISQDLLKADAGKAKWQAAASACHMSQAAHDLSGGDLPAALARYQAALAINEQLSQADPGELRWKRNSFVARLGIGDVLHAQRQPDAALREYLQALSIAQDLVAAKHASVNALADLVRVMDKLPAIHREKGDVEAVLKDYQAMLPVALQLAQAQPKKSDWRDMGLLARAHLGAAHTMIGDEREKQGDPASALKNYVAARAQFQIAADADKAKPEYRLALAEILGKMAMLDGTSMPLAERKALLNQGLATVLELQRLGQLPAAQAAAPTEFRQALATLK